MNETPRREAHLASVARDRTRRRDQRIADRLAELVQMGVDPAVHGGSVAEVLVEGGLVSRATYYRHKTQWTWSYLLEELLPIHRPKAAARLARLRNGDPQATALDDSYALSSLIHVIASTTPQADEQDLTRALEAMMVEGERAVAGATLPNARSQEDFWFRIETTARVLVDRLALCRPTPQAEWHGAATVVANVYEFAGLPGVCGLNHRPLDLHSLDEPWIYCLVHSGTTPQAAVRTVQNAWESAHPDFVPYDRALWVSAAMALLDRRGYERAVVHETAEECRQRDEAALVEVCNCARRSAPTLFKSPGSYPIDETGNVGDILLTALRWDWARESPYIRRFANIIDRATQGGSQLRYGNRADESTAFAWAASTLAAMPTAQDAAEVLLQYTLRQCQNVGREPGGTSLDLRTVPPVAASYLVDAGRLLPPDSGIREALTDFVERLRSAGTTPNWSRLPWACQEAWRKFVDAAPPELRLRPASPAMRRLTKLLDSLESDFTAGARVEVEDVAALTEATERLAGLTAWATSADWSAPWDTPAKVDVGTPFNRPPSIAPDYTETLRRAVRRRVDGSIAQNLARNTMAVRWEASAPTD